jgi:hypothetical protein
MNPIPGQSLVTDRLVNGPYQAILESTGVLEVGGTAVYATGDAADGVYPVVLGGDGSVSFMSGNFQVSGAGVAVTGVGIQATLGDGTAGALLFDNYAVYGWRGSSSPAAGSFGDGGQSVLLCTSASQALAVSGVTSLDGGAITTDGSGNLSLPGGTLLANLIEAIDQTTQLGFASAYDAGSGMPAIQATQLGVTNDVSMWIQGSGGNLLVGLPGSPPYDDGVHKLQVYGSASFDSGVNFLSLPSGTLASPPAGLNVGDVWQDTTSSTQYPILRLRAS